jgi:hypothetical protein
MLFGLIPPTTLKCLALKSFDLERTWWRFFQKRLASTNFEIHVWIWTLVCNTWSSWKNRCLLLHNTTLTTISLRKGALSLSLSQYRCCCSLLPVKYLKYITHILHDSNSNKEHSHFIQYTHVFRKCNLNWLLGRMQCIICDLRIKRTPSLVFDWWKHYSGLTYLWMQYARRREGGHICSGKK